jgi:hypothetical protein
MGPAHQWSLKLTQRGDVGPITNSRFKQANMHERPDRLTNRVAAQTELRDKFILWRNALANRPSAGRDQLLQLTSDLHGQV